MSVLDNNYTNIKDKLDSLESVHQVTRNTPVSSKGNVAKSLERVVIGVQLEKHLPDLPARVAGQCPKYGIQHDAWTIAQLRQSPSEQEKGQLVVSVCIEVEILRDRVWSKDICGNQIEDGAPSGCPSGPSSLHPFLVGYGDVLGICNASYLVLFAVRYCACIGLVLL